MGIKNLKFLAKFGGAVALVLALLFFNWDRTELENRAFVVAMGIDACEEAQARFKVSLSIADTAALEKEKDGASMVRTATGQSLNHTMGQVDAGLSSKIYFGHTKAVVLGEGVLVNSDLLREVVDSLSRNNEINIKTVVLAAEKTAAEILSAKPKEQNQVGMYLAGFYNKNDTNTAALAVKLDLEGLDSALLSTKSVLIPKVAVGDDEEVVIGGVAAIRDFALAGHIPEKDLGGFLWLKENAAGAMIPIETEDGFATFLTSKSKAKIGFYENNGLLHCRVQIKAKGGAHGADIRHARVFEEKIEKEIEEIFGIMQHMGVDGPNLKEELRKKERKLFQKYESDWGEAFKNIVLQIKVDITIS